uniref:Serine/threonine-protein phosphatase 7 long form homolog n=1 Tax=Nicotiana sylvestris TaxID=4096 RepID=A0A1U7YNN2_NICSY|nr:PREDICTED: serine/threonine-protein phosphatase 7 long form homolog [Nicotiana sylvestris]
MALIEQWRPETHIFHFPIGEATITLQDVEVLYGLPVNGHPVALPPGLREYTGDYYLDMLQRLTGFRPADERALSGATCLQLTFIQQHLEAMHDDMTHDTPDLYIDRYTSWGAAILSYLYRQICRASMSTQHDIAGFLPLLHPPLPPLAPDAPPMLLPLARRWVKRRGYGREYEARHNLPLCRDLLDLLEGAQSSSISLMCLDIVEHNATERGGYDIYGMAKGANRYLEPATRPDSAPHPAG